MHPAVPVSAAAMTAPSFNRFGQRECEVGGGTFQQRGDVGGVRQILGRWFLNPQRPHRDDARVIPVLRRCLVDQRQLTRPPSGAPNDAVHVAGLLVTLIPQRHPAEPIGARVIEGCITRGGFVRDGGEHQPLGGFGKRCAPNANVVMVNAHLGHVAGGAQPTFKRMLPPPLNVERGTTVIAHAVGTVPPQNHALDGATRDRNLGGQCPYEFTHGYCTSANGGVGSVVEGTAVTNGWSAHSPYNGKRSVPRASLSVNTPVRNAISVACKRVRVSVRKRCSTLNAMCRRPGKRSAHACSNRRNHGPTACVRRSISRCSRFA